MADQQKNPKGQISDAELKKVAGGQLEEQDLDQVSAASGQIVSDEDLGEVSAGSMGSISDEDLGEVSAGTLDEDSTGSDASYA